MKKILLALSLTAAAFSLHAFDTAAPIAVKTGIREYTRTGYIITEKFGDYYRSPSAKYVHVFDVNGKEIESTELTNKDILVDKVVYEYNTAGQLVTTTCTDAEGKINWKIITTYDANGNKIDESQFNASDILVSKSIWKYNGKQAEESYYDTDGSLLSKTITKFDDAGREAEVCQYASEGYLEEKRVFSYNDANKLSEITYSGTSGAVSRKIVYRFDANYAITEEQTYDASNKLVTRVIYKYDDNGNITRTTTYNVAEKFGTTVNELIDINEYTFSNTVTVLPTARNTTTSSSRPAGAPATTAAPAARSNTPSDPK